MGAADELRTVVAVEMLDGRGEVLGRAAAEFVAPSSLRFTPPTAACAEQAWTIRALDAHGRVVNETPTVLGEAMRQIRERPSQKAGH